MFAKLSPDGKKVAYVSQQNIYVEDLATGAETALTTNGNRRLINGTFDWVYEEEFSCRDGFRWSPDGKQIAYWQVDAAGTREFYMINNTDSIYSRPIPVEYPKVGEPPSAVKIGVVNMENGQTNWMQIPGDPRQHYLPRMEWVPGTSELIVQQLNRKQNESQAFYLHGCQRYCAADLPGKRRGLDRYSCLPGIMIITMAAGTGYPEGKIFYGPVKKTAGVICTG